MIESTLRKFRGRRWAALGLLGVLATVAARANEAPAVDFSDPPQGVFLEDWMLLELQGQKVGYSHAEIARRGDEIHTTMLLSMSISRAGESAPITMLNTTRESLAGEPLAFTQELNASVMALSKKGRIHDGKLYVANTQLKRTTEDEYDFPKGALMTWGAFREQLKRGRTPGTTYRTQVYEPSQSINAGIPVEVTVHETEPLPTAAGDVEATKFTQQMLGTSTTTWVDPQWRTLKASLQMMGMTMTMTRCTREEALAQFAAPEFFMPTTIKAPCKIDRDAAQRIDYVLRLKKPLGDFPTLPNTGMQTVTEQGGQVVRLSVRRMDPAPFKAIETQKFGADLAEFLSPNPLVDSEDPAVMAMAKVARGDAVRPYEIGDRLRNYVTEVIADKNLAIGFATASEVCRNKEGDCSEHAVLLAALGRASGLPSRVVVGIVYVPVFGGDADIFGFHMWTQFRIGDAWVDFDAAQRESVCNATHIAFSVSSLKDAGLGQIAIDLINVIGNLDLEITAIEPSRDPQCREGVHG